MKKITEIRKFATIWGALWLMALIAHSANGQTVSIGTIPASSFCGGDSISVSFTATGYWQHRNAFTLQLSDPTGSFTTGFTNLASIKDTLPGTFTIAASVPTDIGNSAHYRFRIMAALPYMTSADNGSDIAISQQPKINIYASRQAAPVGDTVFLWTMGSDLNMDSIYWDFGADATPPTASGLGLAIIYDSLNYALTYSTGGTKTITARVVTPGGCSTTSTTTVQVFDCTPPVIPHNAVVVDSDGSLNSLSRSSIWINPGVSVSLGGVSDTIFVEAGATVNCGYGYQDIFYLKPGAAIVGEGDVVIYASGANPGNSSGILQLSCPTLTFDYTNAPPNSAMPAGVNTLQRSAEIIISPNPTSSRVAVDGLPSNARNITVENVLGQSVEQLRSPGVSQLSLDLGSLTAGTYYLRFVTGETVVTKKIVKQ